MEPFDEGRARTELHERVEHDFTLHPPVGEKQAARMDDLRAIFRHTQTGPPPVDAQLDELSSAEGELDRQLERLAERLGAVLAPDLRVAVMTPQQPDEVFPGPARDRSPLTYALREHVATIRALVNRLTNLIERLEV